MNPNGYYYRQPILFNEIELELYQRVGRLWTEQIFLLHTLMVSKEKNSADLKDITARLLQNPHDLSGVIQPYYGEKKAKRFDQLLTTHILHSEEMMTNLRGKEVKNVNETREKWYDNARQLAELMESLNPFWDQLEWQNLLQEKLNLTEEMMTSRMNKNYEKELSCLDELISKGESLAEDMVEGLKSQFSI